MGALVFNNTQTVICGIAFLESVSTFSTVTALGTEKPFGWTLCQALQNNTYSYAPHNCWRHPPSLVKGESLEVGEADDGCRHSKKRGKRSRKEDWNWSEILLPSVDQSCNWAQGRQKNSEKECMKLVKTNRDTLPTKKLKLQIRKSFLRRLKVGNRL